MWVWVNIPIVDLGSSLLDGRCLAVIGRYHLVGHLVYVVNHTAVCGHVRQQSLVQHMQGVREGKGSATLLHSETPYTSHCTPKRLDDNCYVCRSL